MPHDEFRFWLRSVITDPEVPLLEDLRDWLIAIAVLVLTLSALRALSTF